MREIALSEAQPGMVVARSIIRRSMVGKRVLIALPGTVLSDTLIRRLKLFNVDLVLVESEMKMDIPNKDAEMFYDSGHMCIRDIIKSARNGNPVFSLEFLYSYASDLVDLIKNSKDVFSRIAGVKEADDYLSYHCIDVAIYSVMLGLNMRLTDDELHNLAVGAMLHDIGMAKVDLAIINKQGKLSDEEYEEVKKHITVAEEIKQLYPDINEAVLTIISQHHERWNGCGYGGNLRGTKISNLARIVAIADVYDAITSDRPYKSGELPHIAAEYILTYAYTDFDPIMAVTFAKKVISYPVGCNLLLSTGEIGRVVELNEGEYLRPKIEVFIDRDNERLKFPYLMDLATRFNVIVKDIVD